jgi:hypothetical protein
MRREYYAPLEKTKDSKRRKVKFAGVVCMVYYRRYVQLSSRYL